MKIKKYSSFKFVSSLKMAVILIIFFATYFAVGTILESAINTPFAQKYIYNSFLFYIGVSLFLLNIISAAIIRFPWRKKHIPFILAHIGMIVLSIGVIIGKFTALEGLMVLPEGKKSNVVRLENKSEFILFDLKKRNYLIKRAANYVTDPQNNLINENIEFKQNTVDYRLNINAYYPNLTTTKHFTESYKNKFPSIVNYEINHKNNLSKGQLILKLNEDYLFVGSAVSKKNYFINLIRFNHAAIRNQFLSQFEIPQPNDFNMQLKKRNQDYFLNGYIADDSFNFPISQKELEKIIIKDDRLNEFKQKSALKWQLKNYEIQLISFYPNFGIGQKGPYHKNFQYDNPVVLYKLTNLKSLKTDFNFSFLNQPHFEIQTPLPLKSDLKYNIGFLNYTNKTFQKRIPKESHFYLLTSLSHSLEFLQVIDHEIVFYKKIKKGFIFNIEKELSFKIIDHFYGANKQIKIGTKNYKPENEALLVKLFVNKKPFEKKIYEEIMFLEDVRELTLDNSSFVLSFRKKRAYLDFWVGLLNFNIKYRPGSGIVKSYDSFVNVYHSKKSSLPQIENFHIYMNNPLNIKGVEFYQSSYVIGDNFNPDTSVFSLRYDPGKYLVYLGYLFISFGMLLLFYFRKQFYANSRFGKF